MNIGVSPSGKAQDFDSCTRGFESRHPSQYILYVEQKIVNTLIL